jgi:uncharacterized lipoprotein YehR (DUF1307 family)
LTALAKYGNICLVKLNYFYEDRHIFRISLVKIFKNTGGLLKMKLENKRLLQLLAEQYVRISGLEQELSIAESTVQELASGRGLPKIKGR